MEHPELVGLNGPYKPPGEILLTTAANPLVDGSLRDGCLWPRRRTLLLGPAGADLDVALLAEGAQPQLQSQETPAVWNEMPLMVESHKRGSKTAYCEIRTSQGGRREEAMNLLKADGLARPASNERDGHGQTRLRGSVTPARGPNPPLFGVHPAPLCGVPMTPVRGPRAPLFGVHPAPLCGVPMTPVRGPCTPLFGVRPAPLFGVP